MPQTVGRLTNIQKMRRNIRTVLMGNGFYDTVNYTLVRKKYIEDAVMSNGEAVELVSPLSDDRRYIRTSLFSSLLETMAYNLDHYNENVNLFEISKVYYQDHEEERLGMIMEGDLSDNKVKHLTVKTDFYVLKGIVEELLTSMGFSMNRIVLKENDIDKVHFHPYQSAVLYLDDRLLGIFGKLNPTYLKSFKMQDVYYGELILDVLDSAVPARTKAPAVSKYPSVTRDISLLLKDDVKAGDLLSTIKKAGGNMVKSYQVFDVYQGEHIEKGYKSVSLNIVYEDLNKTLTAEDVNAVHGKIVKALTETYDAVQR